MGKSESKYKIQTANAITHPENTSKRGVINIPISQNVLLIWLDTNIDKNNDGCQDNIAHFRAAMDNIDTFTDGEECIQFLHTMAHEKACMIISGSLGQEIVPRVHNLTQVDSIFIFCTNKTHHEEWVKHWSKIRGVFNETEPLCEAVQQAAQQYDQNAISITIMGTEDIQAQKAENRLDPSFMYTQIMKEIFLTIDFDREHFDEFIQYCRTALNGNAKQLNYLEELAQQYDQHPPIWWYTRDTFLYPTLNRVLRAMDVDVMMKIGFFIADLDRNIQQLHQQQFGGDHVNQCRTVYRGQGMEKAAFQKMASNIGGLVSFNGFLSTSRKHSISLRFAQQPLKNAELVGILFVMNIDSTASSTPFASTDDVGYYGGAEQEVLFSMNTVFRIGKVTPIKENNRFFEVELNLASDKDNDLCDLVDYIRESTFADSSGWYRLGSILRDIGELVHAEKVFGKLLTQDSEETSKGQIHNALGTTKAQLGEYVDAIRHYEKSIEIKRSHIPHDSLSFTTSYNNIASVYSKMGDYPKALSLHEKVLEIRQQSLPPTHTDLGMSYNNIASVYYRMADYDKALPFYEKALEIHRQWYPSTHPHVAGSYDNVSLVYSKLSDYAKALFYHEKALEIRQQSLPPTHYNLAMSYNNIGLVYSNMEDYPKALASYEKALEICQQSLPPTHPDLARSYNNIATVYLDMGNYPEALLFHEKALNIRQQALSPTHPDFASSYHNIATVYSKMGNYSEALFSNEKALQIYQQSLPPNHPDLANSYNNIGSVCSKMSDYLKALFYYGKALEARQQSRSPNHSDLAQCYDNIASVHSDMRNYLKALQSYEKALEIRQESLPPDDPEMADSYKNIGNVYYAMGDYPKALLYHEQAKEAVQLAATPSPLDLAFSYDNIATKYCERGDYPRALFYYEKVLEIRQHTVPPTHAELVLSYENIGKVCFSMGDYLKALVSYQEALEIFQQSVSPAHSELRDCYLKIGLVYSAIGDYSKAFLTYVEVITVQNQACRLHDPDCATIFRYMGLLHEYTGKCWKAHSYYQCAVELAEHSLSAERSLLLKLKYDLGRIKQRIQ